jgi:type 1 glutamine amidotransferase
MMTGRILIAVCCALGTAVQAQDAGELRRRAREMHNQARKLQSEAKALEGQAKVIEFTPKITEAINAMKVVKPKKAHHVLIYSRTTGFRHGSIEIGVKVFEELGKVKGLYTSEATEDPAVFTDEKLAKVDLIIFVNTTGEPVPKGAARDAVEKYLSQGKPLVGIHAATDCHRSWPTYLDAMGGLFDGHPWGAGSLVTLFNEEPEHPVAKAVPQGFQIKDEIYQYKDEPYFSRERLRILLALDLAGTNMKKGGMKRKDHDYAVSWVGDHSGSRVFYSNLGHNESTYVDKVALQHFTDGIQWALGDIDGDAKPSAAVGRAKPKALPAGF